MLITRKSQFTGKFNHQEIDVTEEQLYQWHSGKELIQNALPHLSADDREFLMTGVTKEEWDAVYPEED